MGTLPSGVKRRMVIAALLGSLVVAVTVYTSRIRSPIPARGAVGVREASPRGPLTRATAPMTWHLTRNPFKSPRSTRNDASANARQDGVAGTGGRVSVPWLPAGPIQVDPLGSGPYVKPAEPKEPAQEATGHIIPKPTFTLLATVQGAGQVYGVIRIGGSEIRTVRPGEVLRDGFRVKKLEPDYAVLTDGRDTIIAKKPQPCNMYPYQLHGRQPS